MPWANPLPVQHRGPVAARPGDIAGDVLGPEPGNLGRMNEKQLSIDDPPGGRVGIGGIAARNRIGAIAAELRRKGARIGLERGTILVAGEMPDRPFPHHRDCGRALNRGTLGEIGHRVIAANGGPVIGIEHGGFGPKWQSTGGQGTGQAGKKGTSVQHRHAVRLGHDLKCPSQDDNERDLTLM